jgi:hypothetical protein
MYSTVPPEPGNGGAAEPGGEWGIRRAVRLAFPDPAALAHDATHNALLSVYLTDLLSPYGLALEPGALEGHGHSYGEMAEALIKQAVPAGKEEIDLLILVYAIPDIAPGRATTTYLSHVCPGTPMAFAISDQGTAAAFTGLRLIREYARADGLRRALLIVVEQAALPYDPGVPVAIPTGHTGVALVFGELGDLGNFGDLDNLSGDQSGDPGQSRSNRAAHLGPVTTHPAASAGALLADSGAAFAGEVGALCAGPSGVTAILGAALADQATALTGVDEVRIAPAGQPYTGVWWELVGELTGPDAQQARRLVLADYDPGLHYLSLAAIDSNIN